MQRIPNPVSNPDVFIRVFCDINRVLSSQTTFDTDDISRAMIACSDVTSQGAIGEEALRRSTRVDRSRDPIYNQSKMYAELFRTLGWIQSTPDARLRYSFSLLGNHLVVAHNPVPLMCECLLGLAYPNEVLGVKSNQTIRVISAILLTMEALGSLSRDEIMAGPMSIADDTDNESFRAMIERLNECRSEEGALDEWLEEIAANRGISRHPTMENYTRFPIGVLVWTGWSTKHRGVLTITPEGAAVAAHLHDSHDTRISHFNRLPDEAKSAFIRWTLYSMLDRAGFNVTSVQQTIDSSIAILKECGLPHTGNILFSPFQQLSQATLIRWTPELVNASSDDATESVTEFMGSESELAVPRHAILTFDLTEQPAATAGGTEALVHEINSTLQTKGSVERTAKAIVNKYAEANRDVFYPLVANLFCILGFNCRVSRAGQNYERADAMIIDEMRSIPIEIKSPAEETEISVKGVRQALENKIIMLSRRNYPTDRNTTSLVVGFNLPNERSEVYELVDDIQSAFNIRLGVIDLHSLVILATHTVASGKELRLDNFHELQGVIRVHRFTTAN